MFAAPLKEEEDKGLVEELGAAVVVDAADDGGTPFLDVFRRGAATARAIIMPRLGGSGAAEVALPLVVVTAAKQLCELVRAKDAILEERERERERGKGRVEAVSFFLCFSRVQKTKKKESGKTSARFPAFFSTSLSTTSSTNSTATDLSLSLDTRRDSPPSLSLL